MPLIKGFRSTTIWKAFVLNSMVPSLVILIAISVKSRFDKYYDNDDNEIKKKTSWKGIFAMLIATFITSMLAYTIMYFVFGYGDAMTINP